MAELTPQILEDVLSACQSGADEAGQALTRALGSEIKVEVGEAVQFTHKQALEDLDCPGLAVAFSFGEVAAVALLPESAEFLPQWYATPDATGRSKLTTLAQELSMLLVPEEFMADDFNAGKVSNLAEALKLGEVTDGAGQILLNLKAGDQQAVMRLIWPAANWSQIFRAPEPAEFSEPESEETSAQPEVPEEAPTSPTQTSVAPSSPEERYQDEFDRLPPYSRSLLRIKLPVMVNLASKKQSIERIVELGAGTIIKFEKSCDELLELEVNGHPVARGEAVKVGDKFGLRINSMIIPEEQFKKLESPRRA